jgi:hypothetical protein
VKLNLVVCSILALLLQSRQDGWRGFSNRTEIRIHYLLILSVRLSQAAYGRYPDRPSRALREGLLPFSDIVIHFSGKGCDNDDIAMAVEGITVFSMCCLF